MTEKHHPAEESVETPAGGSGLVRKFFRYFYNRFVRLHGSPEDIAWGAAVGFFVAMTPTMGLQTVIAVPIAALFRISKVAAAATVWITNPLTAPFLYGLNYMVGAKLLGYPLKSPFFSSPSWETFWNSGRHVMLSLTVGGLIMGAATGLSGYLVILFMVRTAREKARRRRLRRKG
jgi:uncharacterized protein (DUF2062 family)